MGFATRQVAPRRMELAAEVWRPKVTRAHVFVGTLGPLMPVAAPCCGWQEDGDHQTGAACARASSPPCSGAGVVVHRGGVGDRGGPVPGRAVAGGGAQAHPTNKQALPAAPCCICPAPTHFAHGFGWLGMHPWLGANPTLGGCSSGRAWGGNASRRVASSVRPLEPGTFGGAQPDVSWGTGRRGPSALVVQGPWCPGHRHACKYCTDGGAPPAALMLGGHSHGRARHMLSRSRGSVKTGCIQHLTLNRSPADHSASGHSRVALDRMHIDGIVWGWRGMH